MDADQPLPPGAANIVMPRATGGENVVLSHSGWGDGYYPLVATFSATGQMLAIHLDLLVVGPVESDEDTADGKQPQESGLRAAQPKNFIARLFARR